MALRVLMFGWEFPPYNSGGLGTACHGLSQALANHDINLTFILPRRLDINCDYMEIRGAGVEDLDLIAINSNLRPYITSHLYQQEHELASMYQPTLFEEVRAYGQKASELASELSFDLIHAHDWLSVPAALAAQTVSRKPLVLHIHATEYDRTGGTVVNDQVYRTEKEGMIKADQIIAVSERTKSMIIKYYGISESKIKVVYNGIRMEPGASAKHEIVKLKRNNKIVLFVGRITLQKGPDYFIRAAKKVLEHEPNVYFIIAGSGDMERQIIEEVARQEISDRVIFAGFARDQELQELYLAADLYVLPSVSEPFGITPLESLACGTPVLVSKQSGVAEVLKHCLKADFWDVDEMANLIISVLRSAPLRRTLADHGYQEASDLTWDRAASECQKIYSNLCPQFS